MMTTNNNMNLFLINTPFQLLCALEAKAAYGLNNTILAVTRQAHEKSQKQLDTLIVKEDWDHIINLPGTAKAFTIPLFIYSLKIFSLNLRFDNVIFPDYLCWRTNLILKNINAKREIMIDDGAMTITQYESHLENKKSFSRNKGFKDLIVRSFLLQPVTNIVFRDKFELFSIFTFPSNIYIQKKNEFNVLKEKIATQSIYNKDAPAGFLGQGYIGDEFGVKINDYIENIEKYHALVNKKIIYFPHRSESNEVKSAVSALNYIHYHDSEWPIELEIYQKNITLSSIAGIASTALYSLSVIYTEIEIYNLVIKDNYYKDQETTKRFKLISKYYENKRIINIQH